MARAFRLLSLSACMVVLTAGRGHGGVVAKRPALDDETIAASLDPARPADLPIIAARKAVADEPQSVPARIGLGNAYLARAWVPEAIEAFLEGTRLDPESSVAWNNVGIAYNLQDDEGRARTAFLKAAQADPRNAEAHYNLAASLERQRNFDGAVQHYREALRLVPSLGNPILNPLSQQAPLLLPTRISLYLESYGSRTLPPQPPDGMRAISGGILDPGMITPPSRSFDPAASGSEKPPAGSTGGATDPAGSPPIAPVAPTPEPTPIQVGPQTLGVSGTRAAPTPTPRPGSDARERVRRGGPLPPKPKATDE